MSLLQVQALLDLDSSDVVTKLLSSDFWQQARSRVWRLSSDEGLAGDVIQKCIGKVRDDPWSEQSWTSMSACVTKWKSKAAPRTA